MLAAMTDSTSWLPPNLLEAAEREARTAWLETLPATVARLCEEWSLTVGAPFFPGGQTAWVAPAHDASGVEMVLKVAWRHPEGLHEADALRVWAGHGAARLYAAAECDTHTTALLIERCSPGASLAVQPEPEQDLVVTGLLRRLWEAPTAGRGFRPLSVMAEQWTTEFERALDAEPHILDPGLAREAVVAFRTLPHSAERRVLLVTDLHAGNVLAAQREPWLVIDPKPYVGDPAYDGLQHLLNCEKRLHADPVGMTTRMADLLEVDAERLRRWMFARCVLEAPGRPSLAVLARRLDVG
jgi:streptomycin 6-kinase